VSTDAGATYKRQKAADELGIHLNTLDKLIKQGKIPAIKLGRAVRIPRAAIEEMLTGGAR
jgi:excisionase family DNA binding protein